MNPSPYLLQAQDRFYPYSNLKLMLICIAENRREGLAPQGVFKLVPEGLGYAYAETTEEELRAEVKPRTGLVQLDHVVA